MNIFIELKKAEIFFKKQLSYRVNMSDIEDTGAKKSGKRVESSFVTNFFFFEKIKNKNDFLYDTSVFPLFVYNVKFN